MFERLVRAGYEVEFHSHAEAILRGDFPAAADEIERALIDPQIPIEEIIAGGGGEARSTQRLRRAFAELGWPKMQFVVERRVNNVPHESQTHEIDHVREFENGKRIALEIEWNNKDPFCDRDLENFKRLHADGAISIGVIVTRGAALHEAMKGLVARFVDERDIRDLNALGRWGYNPTARQRAAIMGLVERETNPLPFGDAFSSRFVADKFGEATTHWRKLGDRVRRGVGNPCPLVLIGLPAFIVTFD
jgi:hypothetical protein